MVPQVNAILSSYQGNREELIPILQHVQAELGYLPEEGMLDIARFTGVPESQVYGVATFYAQFRFTPQGRNHVQVCRGTACHVSGARRILEEVTKQLGVAEDGTTEDLEYSVETVACIGACSLAPCLMMNKRVEAKMTPKKVARLFARGGAA